MSGSIPALRQHAQDIVMELHKLSRAACLAGFEISVSVAARAEGSGRTWPLYEITFDPSDGSGDAQLIVPDFGTV